jgi:hypothetical protein
MQLCCEIEPPFFPIIRRGVLLEPGSKTRAPVDRISGDEQIMHNQRHAVKRRCIGSFWDCFQQRRSTEPALRVAATELKLFGSNCLEFGGGEAHTGSPSETKKGCCHVDGEEEAL